MAAVRVIAGRCGIVTGAARGIGRVSARALAAEGVRVVLVALDADLAQEAADEIVAAGGAAIGRALDVRDPDAWADLVARTDSELSPVDVLVNNAGIMSLGGF